AAGAGPLRRVETPPGVQAQADWVHYPRGWVGGRQRSLLAFTMQLSWSRYAVMVCSERKHPLAWLRVRSFCARILSEIERYLSAIVPNSDPGCPVRAA